MSTALLDRPTTTTRAPAVAARAPIRYGIAAVGGAAVIAGSYSRAFDVVSAQIGLPSLFVPAALAVAVLLAWSSARRLRARTSALVPVTVLAAIHVLLALSTVLWASDAGVAMDVARFAAFDGALLVMVALMVVDTDSLRLALYGIVAGGTFMALVSDFQYLTGQFGQTFFGFASAPLSNVVGEVDAPRIAGSIGDPNFFAQLLAVSAVLAAHLARHARLRINATVLWACAVACGAGVLFSFSRGGLVAMVLGLTVMVLVEPIPWHRLVVVGLGVVVLVALFLPADLTARFGELRELLPGASHPQSTVDDPALVGRQSEALVAVQQFEKHPLFGVGAGNYKVEYQSYAARIGLDQRGEDRSAHSLYLETAAEHGVIGLAVLFGVIGWAMTSLRGARRRLLRLGDRDGAAPLRTAMLGLGTYLVGGLFLHSAFPLMLWLLLAVAIAGGRVQATTPARRFTIPRSRLDAMTAHPQPVAAPRAAGGSVPSVRPSAEGAEHVLTHAMTRGVVITYGTFAASKAVTFAVTIVIARLLDPSQMGLMALALLVTTYMDAFNEFGISSAVVWFERDDQTTRSTAFWVDQIFGLAATVVVFLLAAPVAGFFDQPALTPVLRVMSVSFVLSSLGSVHNALLQRRFAFRRQIGPEVGSSISKGALSIALVAAGFGVWGLVWGQLLGALVGSVWFILALGWCPTAELDRAVARRMIRYGATVASVTFLAVVLKDVDYVVVGRQLGSHDLGLYTLGFRLPDLAVMGVCYAVSKAMFPTLSRLRADAGSLKRSAMRGLGGLTLVTAPLGALLAVHAHVLVAALYGPAWAQTGSVLRYIALYFVAVSASFVVGDVYKATDRTGILNAIALARLPVSLIALVLAAPHGIVVVAACQLALATTTLVIQLLVACRFTELTARDLVTAFRPAAIVAGLTALVGIAGIHLATGGPWPTLIVSGSAAFAVAVGSALLIGRPWWSRLAPPSDPAPAPEPEVLAERVLEGVGR